MILEILGLIHIIHCPLLIIYPYTIINQKLDIYYLTYFFFICFSYTFINGECPISYVSRIIKNKNYIAGSSICENDNNKCENKRNFPEMESVLPVFLYPYIDFYFVITTKIYLFSLSVVVYRNDLFNVVYFPFSVLIIYFFFICLFIYKKLAYRFFKYFKIYQQFTKVILLLTIYFLLESQRIMPLNFIARQLRNECIL